MSRAANQIICNIIFNKKTGNVNLKEREISVMKLICQQYWSKAIADKLGIKLRTVEGYRKIIQKKVGAENSIGVVLYAIKNSICKVA